VFISHNAEDKPRVRRIAERLRAAGLRVWFDEWNVRSGDIIMLKVDEGLEQSRVLLLCVSPNALASGWVALERSTAIHRDPANAGRRFIPLLIADCYVPDTIRRYKCVDLREDSDVGFEELLASCRAEALGEPLRANALSRIKLAVEKLQSKTGPGETEAPAVLERVLKGQRGWVYSLAFSADGKTLASGSEKEIKIWNSDDGDCRSTLNGHEGIIRAICFAGDCQQLLSACHEDKSIGVWSLDHNGTLRKSARWTHGVGTVRSIAVLHQGRTALSACDESAAPQLWDVSTGSLVRHFERRGTAVHAVAGDEAGKRAVSGSIDGIITVWDVESGQSTGSLNGHREKVLSITMTPDGRIAVSGSSDRTVKVWNLDTGACIGILEGHQAEIDSLAMCAHRSLVASTGFTDKTVRLWDLKSGTCLQEIINPERSSPISVAISPDGSRLAVGTTDAVIFLYRLTGMRPAVSAHATRRYVNAKVVLLGEGTVGKTSLAHRLIEDKYVIRDRTHGMNVWRLELPLEPDPMSEREALLWDLAGQEDYRLVHRLFLDETALALLLINPQKQDPFAEAGDWLKSLQSATNQLASKREAARLLIFAQVDVGGMKLGNAKIERFCRQHGFKSWLPTSAKTGENCSDELNGGQPSELKQLIARSIPWNNLPWTSTPRLLSELKNAAAAMNDVADVRLLRFSELLQRLKQALPGEQFGERDVRTAVTLLANHGLARTLKFGDLILLRPELLNAYAGAIIRAARAHIDEIGCVLEADIYKSGFDFTGVERLSNRADEELLLRALVQTFLDHSLCIAEDTQFGRQLVFPSQYRREKDMPYAPDIFVSYTFCGEWQSVWSTLVVRLWCSQEFEHRELWRNAAEFASPKGFTLGLKIDNDQGEGTATISLYFDKEVPDDLKSIFIEYVHRHLARCGCEVSRDRRYICRACGAPVKDLEVVRRRLEAKKTFITCQECDEKVVLIDLIEQRLKGDPVARKIFAMDQTSTRRLDTQALEQIYRGHMMAIAGEANQMFRAIPIENYGINGELEFRDNDGQPSGKRIYLHFIGGNSHLRPQSETRDVFHVSNERYLDHWMNLPIDVYLVLRRGDETTGQSVIEWMNVSCYLKNRTEKRILKIAFAGEKLDMEEMWRVRDQFFPAGRRRRERT
jgi:WD40 repeat protein/RNase P subunit RPR2